MPAKYIGVFLNIFGDLIRSVELDGFWSDNFDDYVAKIEQYCAKTLKNISFYVFKPIVTIGRTFEMLEILKIHYCSIVNIEPLPRLKVLDIRYIHGRSNYSNFYRIFKQKYPQLKVLILDDVHITSLNAKLINDFTVLNPHLRTLQVSNCASKQHQY